MLFNQLIGLLRQAVADLAIEWTCLGILMALHVLGLKLGVNLVEFALAAWIGTLLPIRIFQDM